ncbi:hypothetical protein SCANM63S_04978 [Streptomyces canarius]
MFTALVAQADADEDRNCAVSVDFTVVRAHQHAAGAHKKGPGRRVGRPCHRPLPRRTDHEDSPRRRRLLPACGVPSHRRTGRTGHLDRGRRVVRDDVLLGERAPAQLPHLIGLPLHRFGDGRVPRYGRAAWRCASRARRQPSVGVRRCTGAAGTVGGAGGRLSRRGRSSPVRVPGRAAWADVRAAHFLVGCRDQFRRAPAQLCAVRGRIGGGVQAAGVRVEPHGLDALPPAAGAIMPRSVVIMPIAAPSPSGSRP